MTMNNSKGNEIAAIGSNLYKDGLIVIRDKNGNFGWGMVGMKELKKWFGHTFVGDKSK